MLSFTSSLSLTQRLLSPPRNLRKIYCSFWLTQMTSVCSSLQRSELLKKTQIYTFLSCAMGGMTASAKRELSKWQELPENKGLGDIKLSMMRNAKMDLGYGQQMSSRSRSRTIFLRDGNRGLTSRPLSLLTMEECRTIQTISQLISAA